VSDTEEEKYQLKRDVSTITWWIEHVHDREKEILKEMRSLNQKGNVLIGLLWALIALIAFRVFS